MAFATNIHFDRGSYKPVKMPNGWLKADATLTRPGVFVYKNPDGSPRYELRPPEEVFAAASLDTLNLVPVTHKHPPVLLDATNTKEYAVGTIGGDVRQTPEGMIGATIVVTDAQAVAAAESGAARELSCAYTSEDEIVSGEYQGQHYDVIQRNIRYNHVALEPQGRAGHDVKIHMDAAEGEPVPLNQHKEILTVKIKIDGIEYEVSDHVGQAIGIMTEKHEATVKALKAETDKLQAKMDATTEQVDKLSKELAAAPAKMQEEIKARVALEQQARPILGADAKMDGMTSDQIRLAVLAKTHPNVKLDGMSADYIAARFDAAVEMAITPRRVEGGVASVREIPQQEIKADSKTGLQPGWRNAAWKTPSNQ